VWDSERKTTRWVALKAMKKPYKFGHHLALGAKWGLTFQIFWWAIVAWADELTR
jgi:hypothetical protein